MANELDIVQRRGAASFEDKVHSIMLLRTVTTIRKPPQKLPVPVKKLN
jgi:hypothetical protein